MKLIPKWKATHITAIPLEPEPEDDPTSLINPLLDQTQLQSKLVWYNTKPQYSLYA